MTDTPKQTVNWKLPKRIASANAGDWSRLRTHLSEWADSGDPVDAEPDDALTSVCLRMPTHVVEALDREAARLTALHGKRYTAGYVARIVWDTWPPF